MFSTASSYDTNQQRQITFAQLAVEATPDKAAEVLGGDVLLAALWVLHLYNLDTTLSAKFHQGRKMGNSLLLNMAHSPPLTASWVTALYRHRWLGQATHYYFTTPVDQETAHICESKSIVQETQFHKHQRH